MPQEKKQPSSAGAPETSDSPRPSRWLTWATTSPCSTARATRKRHHASNNSKSKAPRPSIFRAMSPTANPSRRPAIDYGTTSVTSTSPCATPASA